MQVGSLMGSIVGCYVGMLRKQPILVSTGRYATYGTVMMPLVTCGMTYTKMKGKEEIEWQDRAWRLQRHKTQNLVDVGSDVGLAVGLWFGSAGLGTAAGTLGVVALNFVISQSKSA